MVNLCCTVVQERNLMSKSRTDFATKTLFFYSVDPSMDLLRSETNTLDLSWPPILLYTTLTIQIHLRKESPTFSMRYQILTAWLRTITARCRRIRDSSMFLESLKPSLMTLQLKMALIQSFESKKKKFQHR